MIKIIIIPLRQQTTKTTNNMAKFRFIRRKCDVERYNRAKKVLENVTFPLFEQRLQQTITHFELESKLIELFINHPNLEIVNDSNAKGGVIYTLNVNLIAKDRNNGNHFVKPSKMSCRLVGENYTDRRLNIGADYHYISVVSSHGGFDYWHSDMLPFLVSQLENQDKLEEMCEQLNLMEKNWF